MRLVHSRCTLPSQAESQALRDEQLLRQELEAQLRRLQLEKEESEALAQQLMLDRATKERCGEYNSVLATL